MLAFFIKFVGFYLYWLVLSDAEIFADLWMKKMQSIAGILIV
jgi:hypothetical protein